MAAQVITISRDGQTVSGLQRKPGQGIDLLATGRASGRKATVTRVSLIEFDADAQAFYVDVLQEVGKGKLTYGAWAAEMGDVLPEGCRNDMSDPGDFLLFDSYDDGVKAEVAYLDALRKRHQH